MVVVHAVVLVGVREHHAPRLTVHLAAHLMRQLLQIACRQVVEHWHDLEPVDQRHLRAVDRAHHAVLERRPLAHEGALIVQHLVECAEEHPTEHRRSNRNQRAADSILFLMVHDGAEQLDGQRLDERAPTKGHHSRSYHGAGLRDDADRSTDYKRERRNQSPAARDAHVEYRVNFHRSVVGVSRARARARA